MANIWFLVALLPILLPLNWVSYMAILACLPAMLYCALRAPHLTPRAQALTFSLSAVASMLPLEKGVAWTLWPTLNEIARCVTTPANIPNLVGDHRRHPLAWLFMAERGASGGG